MITTLYLVRHGQTEWNKEQRMQGWQNSDLTEVGKEQADLLGKKLKKETVSLDAFFSSPSQRALETRHLINNYLGVKEFDEPGLQEINMGSWEGNTYQEIEKKYSEEWYRFWHTPLDFKAENNGETFEELSNRSKKSIENIISTHQGENIAIISHRITIKTIVADLLNVSINDLADVEPNSVTKITITNKGVVLDVYSDTSHYQK